MSSTIPRRPEESSDTQPTLPGTDDPPPQLEGAPAAGTQFGSYLRTKKLGEGGVGEVWKAWDAKVRRWVALKFLKSGNDEEVARFQREARMAATLTHPNIATIFEASQAEGQRFIAMQFVDGIMLQDLDRSKRREIVRIIRDAALAVHFAHEKGIIHRDLKPENIMVTRSGRVYVMDFGLARPVEGADGISRAGFVLGTPSYMSPEQTQSRTLDGRTDVYSLGATLYAALSGRLPFEDTSAFEIFRMIETQEAESLRKIDPAIEADLEAIVMKCMEKERKYRYPTALDLADELTRWLDGEAVNTGTFTIGYRFGKALKRRRTQVALGVAALLVLGGVLVYLLPRMAVDREKTRQSTEAKEKADDLHESMRQLNALLARGLTAHEWRRQAFRNPVDIRAELQATEAELVKFVAARPAMAQGWFARGRIRFSLGRLKAAAKDLEKAVELEPEFFPAWTLLARVRLEEYMWVLYLYYRGMSAPVAGKADGLEEIRRVLERGRGTGGPDHMTRWGLNRSEDNEISEILVDAFQRAMLEEGKADAIRRLTVAFERHPNEEIARWIGNLAADVAERDRWHAKAVAIAPHYALTYYDQANARFSELRFEASVSGYSRALEIDPLMEAALLNRAGALINLERFDEASTDLERAFAIGEWKGMSLLTRGELHRKQARFGEAEADFRQAVEEMPTLGPARVLLANVLRTKGDLSGALEILNRLLVEQPRYSEAHVERGMVHGVKGDLAEALKDFNRGIEMDRKNWEAYVGRGVTQAKRGDPVAGIADHTFAIEINPYYSRAYLNRGAAHEMTGDLAAAMKDYDKAIDLTPRDIEAVSRRAYLRYQTRVFRGAAEDYTVAMTLSPANLGYLQNRGVCWYYIGMLDAALGDFNALIERDGKDPQAYYFRSVVRGAKRDAQGRVADLKKALDVAPPDWPQRAEVEAALQKETQ